MNFRSAILFVTLWANIATGQVIETKLVASNGGENDLFGWPVSLSGDYAIIGAAGWVDDGEAGSAYIFHYDGLNWIEQTRLRASDGQAGDSFGYSVSISGEYALVGASEDDNATGCAYIFHYTGSSWIERAKLVAGDRAVGDRFGASVSLSGNYALVGAWGNDDNGDATGSAYIFHYDGLSWTEHTKLVASDGDARDVFGASVSISGDYALISAWQDEDIGSLYSGSAYFFHFDGSDWFEQEKIGSNDGRESDGFGYRVYLSGDQAIIGAPGDDEWGIGTGAAYIFQNNGSSWVEQARLTLNHPVAEDYFGTSVTLAGDYALVGASQNNHGNYGFAYVFHYDGSNWLEQIKLTASDGESGDYFGGSVAMSDTYALIGAHQDGDNGTNSGSAYIYNGFATPADPIAPYGVTYGSSGSANTQNPGALLTIDPLTGDATLIGPTGIIGDNGPSVPAIAIKSTGEIYGVSSSSNSGLYIIDASTGAGTFVAGTGLSLPNAMAFDGTDVLYVTDGSGNLYTVDETTGAASLIGPLGINVRGIAFDPTDGTMFGSSGTDGIYTIDPTTATATFLGNTGLGGSTPDIHFDLDGNLFGTKIGGGTIYNYVSINKQTGAGTVIGSTGMTAIIGLSARQIRSDVIPVTIEIEIDPEDQTVPPGGATFPYSITFANNTPRTQVVEYWTRVVRPTGTLPLDGPTTLTLSAFDSVTIDTNQITVPANAVPGFYHLIGYVGDYQVDTMDVDSTSFTKLDDSIPCGDIAQFKARCRPGGLVQAKAIFTDFTHVGETVEISVDQFPYEVPVGINGQATFSQTGFNPGVHTVELTDPDGCFPPVMVTCGAGVGLELEEDWDETWETPAATALLGNYPNPFNPSTTFSYGLSSQGLVTLKVFNMLGQLVRTIVDEHQVEGYYEAIWDGRNEAGASVSSGIYIYRMTSGSFVDTKRMMLIK